MSCTTAVQSPQQSRNMIVLLYDTAVRMYVRAEWHCEEKAFILRRVATRCRFAEEYQCVCGERWEEQAVPTYRVGNENGLFVAIFLLKKSSTVARVGTTTAVHRPIR